MTTTLARTPLSGAGGTSSRIENYLGSPPASRVTNSPPAARSRPASSGAHKARRAGRRLSSVGDSHQVRFESGEVITARSVIIATGARYNRLPLERLDKFEGVGVYYAATQMRPRRAPGAGRRGRRWQLAGQAALFLAQACTSVRSSSGARRSPTPCRAT